MQSTASRKRDRSNFVYPLLIGKFAKQYIARWRIDKESSQVQEHSSTLSATERQSNTADALNLLSYLGCSRVRASTVVSTAKKLPITESRIEQKAKRQREVKQTTNGCLPG